MRPVICIAGPTASGKSAYAVDLAKSVDGEIVNADALQVYTDLRILSARPTEKDMGGVPHHLFGTVPGNRLYSTGDWVREVEPILLNILARDKTPIIVGGTGLYFHALLDGLADIPTVPREIAKAVESLPVHELQEEANRVDPVATANVLGKDPQRLARIVGVFRTSQRPLSEWRKDTRPIIPRRHTRRAVLLPDRAVLYDRINTRFEKMVEYGGLKEAETIYQQRYPDRSPMLKAIGLSHLLLYLDGECDLETAIETAKRDTRRLAKRQMTWFRNRCSDWTVLRQDEDENRFKASL